MKEFSLDKSLESFLERYQFLQNNLKNEFLKFLEIKDFLHFYERWVQMHSDFLKNLFAEDLDNLNEKNF